MMAGQKEGIMIIYKSMFNGWVEVTPEQRRILIERFRREMTNVKESEKDAIINKKFKMV